MKPAIPLLAILLLPAACVSQGPQSQLGTQERAMREEQLKLQRTSDCVFQSSINGFDALDDRQVDLLQRAIKLDGWLGGILHAQPREAAGQETARAAGSQLP